MTKASIRACSRMLWHTLMWRRQPGGDSLGSGGRSADIENYVILWRLGGVGRLRRAVARADETFCVSMLGCIILIYIDAHFSHGRRLPDVSYKVSTSSRSLTQILLRFKTELLQFVPGFSVAHSNKSKYVSLGGTSGLAKNRLSKARDTFSPFFCGAAFWSHFHPNSPRERVKVW